MAQVFLLAFGWRRLALSSACGALAALAMPPFGVFPVLAICFPGLVWLLDGAIGEGRSMVARFRPAFVIGWFFGFGFFLAGLWWIGRAFLVEADVYAWMIPFAVILLPAGLALFTALGVGLAGLVWNDGWQRAGYLAVGLAGADVLRGHVLTGFPWNTWGYAVAAVPELAQAASLFGIYGLGLLVALVFCGLAGFVDQTPGGRRLTFGAVLLFAGLAAFGVVRVSLAGAPAFEPVALRLVQPSIAQEEKWKPENRARVFASYLEMSKRPWSGDERAAPAEGETPGGDLPRIVIWPESAVPFLLTDAPEALSAIAALLGPRDTLVTGAVRADAEGSERVFYNSVYVIAGDGAVRDAYDKVRLVPFGEYLPFKSLLERIGLTRLVTLPGVFRAGFRHRTLEPLSGPSFLPLICYEAIFPGAATTRDARPGWILNVTNDAWFGDTPGPRQHFQQARVRAIEQGLPLVRAANTGLSGVVDPYGRTVARSALATAVVLDTRLPAAIEPPLYARVGFFAPFTLFLVSLGILFVTAYLRNARKD
nr:apolipoprotein N-acyltransferase [Stappia sp. ES.058]